MQRFELLENDDGDAELMPCDTGRLVWWKDVEPLLERIKALEAAIEPFIKHTGGVPDPWPTIAEWKRLREAAK